MPVAPLHEISRTRPIGVAVVGANPERGWAMKAHLPALRILPRFALRAVSTSRPESATAAAVAFGVPAFAKIAPLLARDDVDLVVITVKVPEHAALVEAALKAKKHVLCEWPLGLDAGEARRLALLAAQMGVQGLVGLQARASPAVRYVRDLVREGFVGRLRSTTMIGSGMQWADSFASANAYIADVRNGATMLTIPFGHGVDALCWALGEFRPLAAALAVLQPDARNVETGQVIRKTAADQIVVAGQLEGGAIAAIHYRGGSCEGTNFLWEINGDGGTLRVIADTGHLQMADARLLGARKGEKMAELAIPDACRAAAHPPSGAPENVAHAYCLIAAGNAPTDFSDALRRHEMIAAIREVAGHDRGA